LASSLAIQGCFCGCCRACRTTAVAPITSTVGDSGLPAWRCRRAAPCLPSSAAGHKSDPCCKIPTGPVYPDQRTFSEPVDTSQRCAPDSDSCTAANNYKIASSASKKSGTVNSLNWSE
jgi:hypothetical protein